MVNLSSVDILKAPSNDYMKTVMTQASYELLNGKIIITDITKFETISYLKQNGFSISKEFMDKYNLLESSKLYFNFNIEAKVKFIKKNYDTVKIIRIKR